MTHKTPDTHPANTPSELTAAERPPSVVSCVLGQRLLSAAVASDWVVAPAPMGGVVVGASQLSHSYPQVTPELQGTDKLRWNESRTSFADMRQGWPTYA